MTREEAIRILKNFSLCGVYHQLIHVNDTDSEAISMAIKALEQPEDNNVGKLKPDLSEEYAKSVRNWLVNYQIKCAELQGRYTPYEVLGWVVSDWRKDNGIW